MLYYDRIDISKGIDPTKSNGSKECMIYLPLLFFNQGFTFQDPVYNNFHDLTMLSANIVDVVIITVKDFDYRWITHNICKSEAINLLENHVLDRGYT